MANYKDLHGFEIKHRSSDPSSPLEGEIWYNTTSQKLKLTPRISAWSSGANLGTARYGSGFGFTQEAAGIAGVAGSPGALGNMELYDGSSWTEGGDLTQVGYRRAVCGTQLLL